MKSTKYTLGPWKILNDGTIRSMDFQNSTQMGDYQGVIICSIAEGHGGRQHAMPESHANARLIAAAPTMLDALEKLLNVPVLPDMGHEQQLIDAINIATRVINQAKGE